MRLAVNGRFLAARPTGVQRAARELVVRLADTVDVTLHLPRGVGEGSCLRASRVQAGVSAGPFWEQVELPWRRARDGYDVALDPANAGPRTGRRRVLVLHDAFPVTHPEWYGPAFRHWFAASVAPSARRADRVVMFTRWAADQATEALGLDPARIRIVGQGVEPFDVPPSPDEVAAVRTRFGLPERYLLAAGGGDARKNVAFVAALLPRLDGLPLAVVGAGYPHVHADDGAASGPDVGDVVDGPWPAARHPGDGPRPDIRRLGHVSDDELRALYRGAAVFCFPSRAEGFGRPPLEAMGVGTPVVAADYGAAEEVLSDAAVRLPPDPDAWADAVLELADEGPARRRAVAAGLDRAAAFRWSDAATALAGVCREVAAVSR